MNKLLDIQNLKVHFKGKESPIKAVDGVDLEVFDNEMLCIVGESGSGKSVTALSIMGLLRNNQIDNQSGIIKVMDQDIIGMEDKMLAKLRGNEISMIFQEPMTSLNPVLSIGDQMCEVLIHHKNMKHNEAMNEVKEILSFIGLSRVEEIIKSYPHNLSGGMMQRVMIGMALLCKPKLIIADEPTTALDVTIQAQILELFKSMKKEFGTSIVMITHDLGVVSEIADKVIVMYAGQIVEKATADDLFSNPLHPYTKALMKSIPANAIGENELYSIPGSVPKADNFPVGCRFANRCDIAQTSCFEKMPDILSYKNRHLRCDVVHERLNENEE